MACGFRTKIDPFTWNLERHSTPRATLDFDKFIALERDAIGIRLASEGVKIVKCHDAKCARNLIGRNLILRTNLIFQAAPGEAKSKIAPLRAALGIKHLGETIF
jgi:hypothetical protein